MKDFTLLVIDAQQDFCLPSGALYVEGANSDMQRLGSFIKANENNISQIVASLDSHHNYQIFHQCYWKDKNGDHPKVFTTITLDDVDNGTYTTSDPQALSSAKEYIKSLFYSSKYNLIIWPYHCIIGTSGFTLHPDIVDAFANYETKTRRNVSYVLKGTCTETEHYSIFKAEVPIDNLVESQLDTTLLSNLATKDHIVVAGEAIDYCVYVSLLDLLDYVEPKKITILEDAVSPINHILANKCKELLKSQGVNFSTCSSFKLE